MQSKSFDGCLTNPESGMETRRAYFRNLRSKCRCSCVLQFTWHLGVSSVLHRPLSQIIHCIVLYLDFQTTTSECLVLRRLTILQLKQPCKGRSQLSLRATSFKRLFAQSYPKSEPQPAGQPTNLSVSHWGTVLPAHQTGCTARTRDKSQSRGVKVLPQH